MTTPSTLFVDGPPADMRDRLLYSPITDRPPIRWPGDARLAVWIAPNVEHYEYQPPSGPQVFFNRVPPPDVQRYGQHDYSNRVGFWRFLAVMDDFGLRPTVSLNVAVLEHYPEVREAMIRRGWEMMSHGLYNSRTLYGLDEAGERAFLEETDAIVRKHTGSGFKGMLGPSLSATISTPDLMAEAGFLYHADWQHDDQPTPILTRSGKRLVSIPYSYDLNDISPASLDLDVAAAAWREQFDVLLEEGRESGRVMCLALHPFIIGQPHAIDLLRDFLAYATGREGVWFATAAEIAEHYLAHHYDAHLAHARALAEGGRR